MAALLSCRQSAGCYPAALVARRGPIRHTPRFALLADLRRRGARSVGVRRDVPRRAATGQSRSGPGRASDSVSARSARRAAWQSGLCNGLQSRVPRFNSGRRLQAPDWYSASSGAFFVRPVVTDGYRSKPLKPQFLFPRVPTVFPRTTRDRGPHGIDREALATHWCSRTPQAIRWPNRATTCTTSRERRSRPA